MREFANGAGQQGNAEREAKRQGAPDTNQFFADHDADFRHACREAGIKPTAAQASKWKRGFGRAKGKTQSGKFL